MTLVGDPIVHEHHVPNAFRGQPASPAIVPHAMPTAWGHGGDRIDGQVHAMIKGLSDGDLRRMAEVISQLPPPLPAAEPPDPDRLERARALIQEHRCNFCHNRDFSGEQNVPRLAGQRQDYLVKALREYKSNARRGYDAAMADVMYPVTDADILDLAHFLAHQP